MTKRPLFIVGPCALESAEMVDQVAQFLKQLFDDELQDRADLLFKGSFAKDNRISSGSYRGPGLREGLSMLSAVRSNHGLRVTTDIHDIGQVEAVAEAVESAGANAISLINTLVGTAINIDTGQFKLSNRFGGLSGPAIKPVALAMVYKVASSVKVPVIGLGGISGGADVIEFMLAGATAVQIGTACFAEPLVFTRVIDEITKYLEMHGYDDINQIIGKAGEQL